MKAAIIFESWPTLTQTISSTSAGQRGVGFAFEGDGDEAFDAQLARLPGEQQRQGAVAGDEAEGLDVDGHGGDVIEIPPDRNPILPASSSAG